MLSLSKHDPVSPFDKLRVTFTCKGLPFQNALLPNPYAKPGPRCIKFLKIFIQSY